MKKLGIEKGKRLREKKDLITEMFLLLHSHGFLREKNDLSLTTKKVSRDETPDHI